MAHRQTIKNKGRFMPIYVALLRGIGPGNPNMKGEKLKAFFESLGYTNVAPVIASGNVIFSTASKNIVAMESKIEKELPKKLGFSRAVFIRSKEQLKRLVAKNPFKGIEDESPNYLVVTFFKDG